jgi:hypothetical protein
MWIAFLNFKRTFLKEKILFLIRKKIESIFNINEGHYEIHYTKM